MSNKKVKITPKASDISALPSIEQVPGYTLAKHVLNTMKKHADQDYSKYKYMEEADMIICEDCFGKGTIEGRNGGTTAGYLKPNSFASHLLLH